MCSKVKKPSLFSGVKRIHMNMLCNDTNSWNVRENEKGYCVSGCG